MQTAYSTVPAIGSEGAVATTYDTMIHSARAGGVIPPGRFVQTNASSVGENPPLVTLPVLSADVTGIEGFGFTINDASLESTTGSNLDYALNNVISVLKRGEIWLKPETAVTSVPSQVFVRFTAGAGALTIGRVRGDADTANAVALPGAVFTTICAADGLCKVRYTP